MEVKSTKVRLAKPKWPECRCGQCNRLLFRGFAEDVEIKCPRCGAVQLIGIRKPEAKDSMYNC